MRPGKEPPASPLETAESDAVLVVLAVGPGEGPELELDPLGRAIPEGFEAPEDVPAVVGVLAPEPAESRSELPAESDDEDVDEPELSAPELPPDPPLPRA